MATLPPGPPPYSSIVLPPLPPGWTEHQAPGGQMYYYHAATNQSTYTRPLPGMPFPLLGGMPFMTPGAVTPPVIAPKEKKKERPFSKTPVPGTPWLRVKTTEGNVFWTHKEKKESLWEVPEEIREIAAEMEREEKQKENQEAEANGQQKDAENEEEEENIRWAERAEVERVMEEVKDVVAAGKRKAVEPADEPDQDGHKKRCIEKEPDDDQDESCQPELASKMAVELNRPLLSPRRVLDVESAPAADDKGVRQDSTGNGDQPSFKVPDRVDLSIEEAKALFKTLLQEKNVNPLQPWDTALPLFISDPRYVLLPSVSTRREAFDEYCRDAVRAQRAAKAVALQEETERARTTDGEKEKAAYMQLLQTEVTSTRATWHEFRRKWKKDRRFFGWAGEREKERTFRDWVRGLTDEKKKQAEKAEREFFQLLREHREIKPTDMWKEAKRHIDSGDLRYDAVGSPSLREELFVTYVKTLQEKATSHSSSQNDQAKGATHEVHDASAIQGKQRAERAERGIREREKKVHRERANLERELGRTRNAVGREEGEREFMSLLTDAVRDPRANWDTAMSSLSHDPRFVLCALPNSVQRDLFSLHVARLREKLLTGLHALFAAHTSGLNMQWHELSKSSKKAIRGSVPVAKLGLSDHPLGSDSDEEIMQRGEGDALPLEYEAWQRTRNGEARRAFDAMLGENAFLEFWGRMGKASGDGFEGGMTIPDEGEDEEDDTGGGKADMKKLARAINNNEVEKVLKNDLRWMAFDHVPEQRKRWLREYMERLVAPKLSVHVPDRDKAR